MFQMGGSACFKQGISVFQMGGSACVKRGISVFLPSQQTSIGDRQVSADPSKTSIGGSACFCREDLVDLLSDADEGRAFTQLLQFQSADVRTRRTQTTENLRCRVVNGATVRDLHGLALGRPATGGQMY